MNLWHHENDRWPLWPWLVVVAVGLVDAIWIAATAVELKIASHIAIYLIALIAAGTAWAANKFRHNACIYVIGNGTAFAMLAWPALRIFNHLTMTIAVPWADDMLAGADAFLGLDWHAYIIWLNDNPLFFDAIKWTYVGLDRYAGGFFLALAFFPKQRERCFEFLALFVVSAFLCMMIGMFFPAKAAMAHYLPDLGHLTNLQPTMGTYHLDEMHALRTHVAPVLDLKHLPGLVTFPSFHTAMGLLLIYVCRGNWWILVPGLALNLSMIATTPLLGGHYFIDLIGGALAAAISVVIVRHLAQAGKKKGFSVDPVRAPNFAGQLYSNRQKRLFG